MMELCSRNCLCWALGWLGCVGLEKYSWSSRPNLASHCWKNVGIQYVISMPRRFIFISRAQKAKTAGSLSHTASHRPSYTHIAPLEIKTTSCSLDQCPMLNWMVSSTVGNIQRVITKSPLHRRRFCWFNRRHNIVWASGGKKRSIECSHYYPASAKIYSKFSYSLQ